jgi:hypothetical protein
MPANNAGTTSTKALFGVLGFSGAKRLPAKE